MNLSVSMTYSAYGNSIKGTIYTWLGNREVPVNLDTNTFSVSLRDDINYNYYVFGENLVVL